MPPRRILLVAQITPPSPLSGARRIAGLTRHLARLGHEVTVLTSVVSGSGPVPGAARTIRARDLMVSPLNWRRGNFAAIQGGSEAAYDARPSALASIAVPDLEVVGWLPFALPAALRVARTHARRRSTVFLLPPSNFNYRNALPNKLFEFTTRAWRWPSVRRPRWRGWCESGAVALWRRTSNQPLSPPSYAHLTPRRSPE